MFCTVRGLEALGIARVLNASEAEWLVEFFDGPGSEGCKKYRVNKAHIRTQVLGANTRIYHHDEATGQWLVGRVLQDVDQSVDVRFANRTDVSLPHSDIFVRWKRPIKDPVDYLSRAITETPMHAEARSRFVATYIAQRGATNGLPALLSSAIELNPHQVDVVRRVLSDASQRYLLADEVGLGKTVEAGVIIRQAVLDDPSGHKVVVLVPPALVRQWAGELVSRFGLAAYLDISVFVLPHEMSEELESALRDATMLVIDEAHHLAAPVTAADSALYERISQSGRAVGKLLLLSATPVLRNEAGFLRMLHLLDPVAYDLDDEEGFRAKIANRQSLAEAVASLDPENVLHLEPVLDDLTNALPFDGQLLRLVEDLRGHLGGIPQSDDPALNEGIRVLRAHLSETYRLHRRILRNRRKNVAWLTPNRSGAVTQAFTDRPRDRVEAALENWRISAVASCLGGGAATKEQLQALATFYWEAVATALCNPSQLEAICTARLRRQARAVAQAAKLFNGEAELLESVSRAAKDHGLVSASAVDALGAAVQQLTASSTKVVVFCSAQDVADEVYRRLGSMFTAQSVVRHALDEADTLADTPPTWAPFQTDPCVNVIVCDRRAEEGINLQGGRKAIVHFDLPLDPNRVEQRIGRLDRYGTGVPIRSVVLLGESSLLQKNWFSVLTEGLGVFDRSISSLQYLVEEQLQNLRSNLLLEGPAAFSQVAESMGGATGLVERELRLIDQQDGLDALAPQLETDLDAVADVDDDWKAIRDATEAWVVKTLMFEHCLVSPAINREVVDPPFRFKYGNPVAGRTSTLIPLSGFLGDFLGALDYEAPGSSSRTPLSYAHSYHRKTAIKSGVRPLRYGCEFIEAIKSFSDVDDRGRSFAFWRQVHRNLRESAQGMYFCFDFLVECDLEAVREVLKDHVSDRFEVELRSLSRQADALLMPMVERIWIDEEGNEPTDEVLADYLAPAYEKNGVVGGYIDTNLNPRRLMNLIENLPEVFSNWSERCLKMRETALGVFRKRQRLIDRLAAATRRATIRHEIRRAQLETRIHRLEGEEKKAERDALALENRLSGAMMEGIASPAISIDVCGMILLATESYSSVEKAMEGR